MLKFGMISNDIKLLSLKRIKKTLESILILIVDSSALFFSAFRCLILAHLAFSCCLSFSTSFFPFLCVCVLCSGVWYLTLLSK